MKRLVAAFFYLCYRLETHYFLNVSLKNWLWVVLVAPPVLSLLGRLSWPLAVPISLLGALLLAGTAWARRGGYVIFDREAGGDAAGLDPIAVDEQIRCRAYGRFAVNDQERYVIGGEAQFSFVRTREHIVMAWVGRTRFLLLATSLKGAVGWWYVFVTPDRLQAVQPGTLFCGFRERAALSVYYRPEQEPERVQELYLAFEDLETRQRVLEDLCRDAAGQVTA
jgi:hypothetical protein